MVRTSTMKDFPDWLKLAEDVEPLFGPMVGDPAFCDGLKQMIREGNAFCFTKREDDRGEEEFLGGIVISRQENEIAWFAVAAHSRGRKAGAALLVEALKHLDPARPVTVTTFDKTTAAGQPARRLYESFGFRDFLEAGANPAGFPIVTMMRKEN
jgi:ribosomal protein S18 acetylase RimI-like enzyme